MQPVPGRGCKRTGHPGAGGPGSVGRLSAAQARGPALLTVVAAAAVALLYLLSVRTTWGQRAEDRLTGGLHGSPGSDLSAAGWYSDRVLGTIGVGSLALASACLVAVALWRRRPHLAVAAGALILGANLTTQFLKANLGRPELTQAWWDDPGSFPSGHATVAMSLTLAAILVAPVAMRPAVALGGGVYSLVVGVALVGLDWHRPADVLGAYAVALAWLGLMAAALAIWPDRPARSRRRSARGARVLGAAALAATLLTLVAVGARVGTALDVGGVARESRELVLVAVTCALVVVVTVVAGLRAVAPRARPRGRARGA